MKHGPLNIEATLIHAIKVEAYEQSLACQGTLVTDQDEGHTKHQSRNVYAVSDQQDPNEAVALQRRVEELQEAIEQATKGIADSSIGHRAMEWPSHSVGHCSLCPMSFHWHCWRWTWLSRRFLGFCKRSPRSSHRLWSRVGARLRAQCAPKWRDLDRSGDAAVCANPVAASLSGQPANLVPSQVWTVSPRPAGGHVIHPWLRDDKGARREPVLDHITTLGS